MTTPGGAKSGSGKVPEALTYGMFGATSKMLPAVALFVLGFRFEPGAYGELAVVSVIYSILMVAADGGFDVATTLALRAAAPDSSARNAALAGLVGRCGAVLTVLTAVILVVTVISPRPAAHGLGVGVLGIASLLAALTASARLPARMNAPLLEVRLLFAEKTVVAGALILVATVWPNPAAYAIAVVIGPLLVLVTSRRSRQFLNAVRRERMRSAVSSLRNQLPTAGAVLVGLAATTLYWRVDVLVIGAIDGANAAGGYAIAYYPIMALTSVSGAASVLVLRTNHSTPTLAPALLAFACGTTIAVVLATAAPFVLQPSLLSAATLDSATVFRIAALGVPAMFVNPVLAMRLRRDGRAWFVTGIVSLALIVNVCGNLALVPRMGPSGAAWSSTATEWFILLAAAAVVHRRPIMSLHTQPAFAHPSDHRA